MKKISLDDYLDEIKERPLIYVSGFTLFSKKCLHQCRDCDNQWQATPSNIRMGRGCPECARTRRNTSKELSEEEVKKRISAFGIKYVGGYSGVFENMLVACCRCEYEWSTKAGNVLYGNGCPKCARRRLTVDDHTAAIYGRGFSYVSGYSKMHAPCLHRCDKGHEWSATPANIQRGTGCPSCSDTGFNPEKDATLYVLKSEHGHVKIGITGPNKKRRFQNLKYATPFNFTIVREFQMKGRDAYSCEQELHKNLKDYASGFLGFDACSEWFLESDVTMGYIDSFINEFKNT